jgi:hypothetical protein
MSRIPWLLVIVLAGCETKRDRDVDAGDGRRDVPMCTPPAELTYLCAPLPLGAPDSCAGGPSLFDAPKPDLDKAFPVGCEAKLPFCVGAYPNSVQTCYCQNNGSANEWVCPV